jgi:hypothetical protein
MGNEYTGDMKLIMQVPYPAAQILAHLGIERAEALVEDLVRKSSRSSKLEQEDQILPSFVRRTLKVRRFPCRSLSQ